jgi:imidazolonepropionase-like amidohydrolase
MRFAKITLSILCSAALAQVSPQTPPHGKRIVIAASVLLDGKGRVLRNTRIAIEGSKIVAIDPKAGPVDYHLRGLTVLPGWIDAHVHITWSFGKDGKNAGMGGTTQEAAYQAASNAWVTLLAGFTTVQSVGSPTDAPLRDAIEKGMLPGPRLLTAVGPLQGAASRPGRPRKSAPMCESKKKPART